MKAKDIMTHCVVSIAPEAPIRDAIARMIRHQVSGMPVVAADGKLVGMVTEGDFLRRVEMHTDPVVDDGRAVGIVSRAELMSALGEYLIKPKKVSSASDDSIRRTILAEMKRQPWCPVNSLSIRVRKGFVDLGGTIFDERQRRALHVLVENVQGVKGIHDNLGEFLDGTVSDLILEHST